MGAVVALKAGELAKSRLTGLADPLRRRMAWAMAVDTLRALSATVDEVLVVGNEPALESRLRGAGLAVGVRGEPGQVGMNGALAYGAQVLAEGGCALVLACVGDLPAVRPPSVERVLNAAWQHPRSYLADSSGVGTTMLAARRTGLDPHFQGASAAAHLASGAATLTDERLGRLVPDARRDVDTEADLVDAFRLGVGPTTAALLDPVTGAPGTYASITVTAHRSPSGEQLVITSAGHRLVLDPGALQDGLRLVNAGQRLHAVTTPREVLAAWLE